ncbi:pentatricopeptide repeat-containing protein At3g26540 [Rhodamnia argentea]|uniref:Pentatricopeptide repeat-containing protein At3g26540 n=1 Tax=Rhodamnia argentea TaxID=178133 RepID=A0A8B8P1U0_9MYRT|nr:pentatricopeptide repeat-containing protein At3g26540 [Rhodamnia argentea]
MGVNAASILNHLLGHIRHPKSPSTEPSTAKALTKTILAHLDEGRLQQAVSVLFTSPEPVAHSLYARLFQLCSSASAIVQARKVESHLVTLNATPPPFLLNRAIEAYGKCRCLTDARELFDQMPERDGGSWNAMIAAYVQNGRADKALSLFSDMNASRVSASEVTFASVLGSCGVIRALGLSMQIHGLMVKRAFCGNVILGSSLVDVYGKCGVMGDSRRMFDEMERPNAVSWNVIVRRYLEMDDEREAIVMFFKMFLTDTRPLKFTFSNALSACSKICALVEGMQIHGITIKVCLEDDEVVSSSLIDMYVKCVELESARKIFDQPCAKNVVSWTSMVSGYALGGRTGKARELFNEMPERNVISWNAMLAGYIRSRQWDEALNFMSLMRSSTKDIDHVTLALISNLCTGLSDVFMGKQVHGFVYRCGLFSHLLVCNSILDMYGKCGNFRYARACFYLMSQWRDKVSWNSLLTSYAHHQRSEHAMEMFCEMQWETMPSVFTFGTLLAACANISALDRGKQIHGFMIRKGYEIDIVVRGALIDMYSKCRCIKYALKVFMEAAPRDVVLWNSIILGCCHNGLGKDALELFDVMSKEGIKPDHGTFQGLLRACICEDLVDLGGQIFKSMTVYSVIPRLEHYEQMIELYSRAGQMRELKKFVKTMPFEPTVSMLKRIRGACEKHGFPKLGEWASKLLAESNISDPCEK